MFDFFKTVGYIFQGKLSDAPNHVSKYVFAYLIMHVVSQFLLLIDAFAGLAYYERILYFLPGTLPVVIAGMGASFIGLSLYFLEQGTGSSIADYAEGRKHETKGRLFGFIVSAFLLCAFIYLSVHANLEGVKVPIKQNVQDNRQSVADKIETINKEYDYKVNRLFSRQDSLRKGLYDRKGWKDKGKYYLNDSGNRLDQSLEAQIVDARRQQNELIDIAKSEINQRNTEVAEVGKMALSNLHGLIFAIIPITLLISIFSASIHNRIVDYVSGLDDFEVVADLKSNNLPSNLIGKLSGKDAGLNRRSNRSDYSENRLRVKTIIQENPGISQKQIVEITGLSPRTVGAHVRALKMEGLI